MTIDTIGQIICARNHFSASDLLDLQFRISSLEWQHTSSRHIQLKKKDVFYYFNCLTQLLGRQCSSHQLNFIHIFCIDNLIREIKEHDKHGNGDEAFDSFAMSHRMRYINKSFRERFYRQ